MTDMRVKAVPAAQEGTKILSDKSLGRHWVWHLRFW